MLIRLLGPVDVVDDVGDVHGSTSAIRRTLLALFATHAGRVLSADWLLEHVWNGEVPESGRRALRFHISQLRRELGGLDLVQTCPGGYRLQVAPREVDIGIVESLGRAARDETDDTRAAQLCLEALAFWRGTPFIDASPTSELADETARLEELRLTLTELGYRRRFNAGAGAELVGELVRLTTDHPLRESLWQLLIAAQYRTGRQAEALRSYEDIRSILAETLGVEPSPELQALQRRVLNHDPTLDAAPGRPSVLMLWDVEGAVGLLVRRGQAGIARLANVAELVAAVSCGHGGRLSTSQGEEDGAVVVFESVSEALAAAIEVNARVTEEPWSQGERVFVRCAIHIGHVTVTADGVFGPEVHRCAKLRALAEYGDVLVSDAAARMTGQSLPDDSSIVDEGRVLQGSVEPEHVWRLVHPAVRPRQRHVLRRAASLAPFPVWRTSFVGRSRDVAAVSGLLGVGRLVTLVGPAGVGKTRLAAAVAAERPGQSCFVDLSVATRDGEVDALVADALGSSSAASPRIGVEGVLRERPMLVVLDNCEQVLGAVTSLVEYVLAGCRAVSVLTTSRSPLRVPDEEVFVVPPLPTGPGGAAMQLFIDRATATRGELTANDDVLAQIGAVTARLDGIPLAIELAAARVTAFSVGEILTLLQRDLAGLGDARRPGPDRHRTVRAAIEWSMRMLNDDERKVLCRLSMIPGSFRLSTAIAATSRDEYEERALVAALPVLVEQSLVTPEHRTGPTRYRLLEVIRSVGQDALDARAREDVLDRLLAHCLKQVGGLESPVAPEAGFEEEVQRDAALFSASIDHALATDQIGSGLHLVHDLFLVWRGKAQRSMLDHWITDLVARTDAPNLIRAMTLRRQALIASDDLGDEERAMRLLDTAEADAIAIDDRQLMGRLRSNRAGLDLESGRLDGLEERLIDAIALLDESGDRYVGVPLTTLAHLYVMQARFDQAEDLLRRAEATNPPWFWLINIELQRAICALTAGRVGLATEHAAKALDMAEWSEQPDFIDRAVGIAAMAALARGEIVLAKELLVRTVALAHEHDLNTQTEALAGLAVVSVLLGDLAVASSCRDELRCRHPGQRWLDIATGRLACSFVDLANGDADAAEAAATDVLADAERRGDPYAHLLSLELIAACTAAANPQRATDLLEAATRERTAIGAPAWPIQPYRDAAVRTLTALPTRAQALRTPQESHQVRPNIQ